MAFTCSSVRRPPTVAGRITSSPTSTITSTTGTVLYVLYCTVLYHYLHHRFFECNYGTSGTPLDKMFGTFRDKLKESGTYKGGSEEKVDAKTVAIHDSKSSLFGLPDPGFVVYISLNCLAWALLGLKLTDSSLVELDKVSPLLMAVVIGAGPVVLAQTMANMTDKAKRSIFYPFHKVRVQVEMLDKVI